MKTLRTALSRARHALAPRRFPAVVLLYHRVAELDLDPWEMAVSPTAFEGHMAVLRERFRPVSLGRLRTELLEGRIESGTVAVTFDDGYEDNLTEAVPLLSRYGVHASVFLVSAALGSEGEFWWDQLERLLLAPESVPNTLVVSIEGRRHSWEIGPDRRRPYKELWQLLRPLPNGAREDVLADLRAWGAQPLEARPTHRTLSTEQAAELAGTGVVEVGAHTVTHPRLASLTAQEQRYELAASKQGLEDLLGAPVTQFSYPFGGAADYSPATVALAGEVGFEVACTNLGKGVDRRSDPLRLPRIYVRDADPATFEKSLSRWLGVR